MSQTEERKQIYEVWILRHDGEHICSMSSTDYDKCFEDWQSLSGKWKEAIVAKSPIDLIKPLVTCFDPGLIKEITLRPVVSITESKHQNPYQQKMMRDGLTNTLKNNGNIINPDILDQGYR